MKLQKYYLQLEFSIMKINEIIIYWIVSTILIATFPIDIVTNFKISKYLDKLYMNEYNKDHGEK
jgi:hypothetical protein